VGKRITIGEDNFVLKVTSPCTRCVMITLPQGDLPDDLGILRTVAVYNQVTAGVYASVQRVRQNGSSWRPSPYGIRIGRDANIFHHKSARTRGRKGKNI